MRIWDAEELLEGYKREGIDPTPYYWYTDQVTERFVQQEGGADSSSEFTCCLCVSEEVRLVSSRRLRPRPGAFPHLAAEQTSHQRRVPVPAVHPALPTLSVHTQCTCMWRRSVSRESAAAH